MKRQRNTDVIFDGSKCRVLFNIEPCLHFLAGHVLRRLKQKNAFEGKEGVSDFVRYVFK